MVDQFVPPGESFPVERYISFDSRDYIKMWVPGIALSITHILAGCGCRTAGALK